MTKFNTEGTGAKAQEHLVVEVLTIKSSDKEIFNYFDKMKNKRVQTGSGDYLRQGKIIDVEELNGGKLSNTGLFVYFLEDGESTPERKKVNFSNQNMFKIL